MADLVGYSFRPSESLVSIHLSFLVFLASLWVVLEMKKNFSACSEGSFVCGANVFISDIIREIARGIRN